MEDREGILPGCVQQPVRSVLGDHHGLARGDFEVFSFHGLYFHLVEADEDISPRLYAAREHPLFMDVNTKLAQYMRPYSPDWKEPKDSMAEVFYSWSKDGN